MYFVNTSKHCFMKCATSVRQLRVHCITLPLCVALRHYVTGRIQSRI